MIINGGVANGTVVAEEESEVVSMTGGEQVLAEMTLQSGSGETFAAGNETTGTPFDNPGILWGAAATALLGATLADWQRQREEEEASLFWRTVQGKRAEAAAQAEEEGECESRKKTPGQRAYEAMMQQKHIVGVSQALLNEKAREKAEQAEAARQNLIAKNEDRAPVDVAKVNALVEAQKEADLQAGLMAYYEGRKAGEEKKNIPLACTADNPYGLPVYNKDQTALDWLTGLYQNKDLPGNTLIERTKYILDATQNGYHVHFGGMLAAGDSGFNPVFQDSGKWPNSSNQVGHFLTAVDLSIWANDTNVSPINSNIRRQIALSAIIGHELIGDNVGTFTPVVNAIQVFTGFSYNLVTFGALNRWFLSGEENNLQKIMNMRPQILGTTITPFTNGNSIEDLRLSHQGWVAGEQIENGEILNTQGFAQWIADNLK
ncbi:MAG: hypothetical protein U0V02_01900 [Anaerolineales bacterium]